MKKNSQPDKKINQKQKTKNHSEPSLVSTPWWSNPEKTFPSYADNSFEPPLDNDSKMLVFFWLTEKPQEFVDYVTANPDSVFLNPYIQMAIKLLRGWCLHARSEAAKEGRRLLKEVGLLGLIPKNLPKRRTNNIFLNHLEHNPLNFLKKVERYKKILGQFIHFPYGRDFHKKHDDVQIAFKFMYEKSIPKELLTEDRNHDFPSIVLSFLAYELDIPFFSLRKFYRSLLRVD